MFPRRILVIAQQVGDIRHWHAALLQDAGKDVAETPSEYFVGYS